MASAKKPSGGRKKPLDAQASSSSQPSCKRQRVTAKKPPNDQKQPLDELDALLPVASKKQVSWDFAEQSTEHLYDVTALSGINLKEEEELLVSGLKNRVSEKVPLQNEHKLILEKVPLQKKLTEIITKSGLKDWSNDLEQCLSLCVERRLCNLISSLIKVSKQRVDSDKSRHATVVTSDIREQILAINHKAREELKKKQDEAEKLNELHGRTVVGADEEKDKECAQPSKMQMKSSGFGLTAANVAARASLGMDDLLSRWKRMGQTRQNHEDSTNRVIATSVENARETQEDGKCVHSAALTASGVVRHTSENQVAVKHSKLGPRISIKDVIAVLEREPQMAKSTVLYKLYDRMCAEPASQ